MQKSNIIGYSRWSTLEQGNSDRSSDFRQREAHDAYCERMGWTITERLTDDGKSAFTGENLKSGELGKLTRKLLSGAVDPDQTVIIVEELDRLSRRPPGEMTAWMQPLLSAGVTFVVTNTNQMITADTLNDFGSFVSLMSGAFSGFEFGRKQRDRGNGSWRKRRAAAEDGKLTSRFRARAWLRWNAETKAFEIIDERAAIVREMIRLRIERQMGKMQIATLFNERAKTDPRYRVFSTSVKRPPKLWTASAIGRIIQDRCITGYVQFHNAPRGGERVPVGDPVRVYPPVVTEEEFARANDERLTNQLKTQGRGRAVSNLFGGMGTCHECGSTMQPRGSSSWRTNRDGSKTQHYFIYCLAAKSGGSCTNHRGWPYAQIEKPVLDCLLTRAIDDQHFAVADDQAVELEGTVMRLRRKIIDQEAGAERVLALVVKTANDIAMRQFENITQEIEATRLQLREAEEALSAARGAVTPAEHIVRVTEVRERMESDDTEVRFQARSLVKNALRGLIDEMWFYPDGLVWIELLHGLGSIYIRPPAAYSRAAPVVEFRECDDVRFGRGDKVRAYITNSDEMARFDGYMRRREA